MNATQMLYIEYFRELLDSGKVPCVYATHSDTSRFRVIHIGNKYVTTVNQTIIPLSDVVKFDLG